MPEAKLPLQNLDDRTWEQIAAEATKLIPNLNPRWTDHNPSDLGITLLELFAWLTEGLQYRLNKIPEQNALRLLQLAGITAEQTQPAQVDLTVRVNFSKPVQLQKGSQFTTEEAGPDEAVVFEIEKDIELTPTNLVRVVFVPRWIAGAVGLKSQDLTAQVLGKAEETLNIELLDAQQALMLFGFDRAVSFPIAFWMEAAGEHHGFTLNPVMPKVEKGVFQIGEQLQFGYKFKTTRRIRPRSLRFFQRPASKWQSLEFSLFQFVSDAVQARAKEKCYWLGFIIGLPPGVRHGILNVNRIHYNKVAAKSALSIQGEILGASDGSPLQRFSLAHKPVHIAPVQIRVEDEATASEQVDDFIGGVKAGQSQFILDSRRGEITFGNYDSTTNKTGAGLIPAAGKIISASYRYVAAGASANLPADTVLKPLQIFPAANQEKVIAATNWIPATGGADGEPESQTKRRALIEIKKRDMAVTAKDYEQFVYEQFGSQASPKVAKVRCLPEPGKVTIVLVPEDSSTRRPVLPDVLKTAVNAYLDQRRMLTDTLILQEPAYVEVKVIATLYVSSSALSLEDYKTKLASFLHPVSGGFEEKGWQIGQGINISQVLRKLREMTGVKFVMKLAFKHGNKEKPSIPIKPNEIITSVDPQDHEIELITI